MSYFRIKIAPTRKRRQMDIIKMFRTLLADVDFVMFLDRDLISHKKNKKLWKDFTKSENKYIIMDINHILQNIKNVLDDWESYGYHFFIGKGVAPSS